MGPGTDLQDGRKGKHALVGLRAQLQVLLHHLCSGSRKLPRQHAIHLLLQDHIGAQVSVPVWAEPR